MTKVVILAGGLGTRLSEETHARPKPMVEVAGKPIIWHIMRRYSMHGASDFVICLGYLGYQIKEYFANYFLHSADVTIDLSTGSLEFHQAHSEPWRVTLVDTGLETMTGGRLRRVRQYLGDEAFCMTYGDGVADVDITAQLAFHKSHGKMCTMTVVLPPGRFGSVEVSGDSVESFQEKVTSPGSYINGGFFVINPEAIDLVAGDEEPWERYPLETLAATDELRAWKHHGFWQPMDTLRDKRVLEERASEFVV